MLLSHYDDTPYFRKQTGCGQIFLRIKIPRKPKSLMNPRQRKGRQLFFDIEKIQILLLRKFIAKSHLLIEISEPHNDVTVCVWLIKITFHLLIMVEYFTAFSPCRFPRLFKFGK